MKIPALINFTDVNERLTYTPNSKEYKALQALNENGEWKEYCNDMLNAGVSVRFDSASDVFYVQPDKFKDINEAFDPGFEDDDDIDVESIDDDFLTGIVNGNPYEEKEEPFEQEFATVDDTQDIEQPITEPINTKSSMQVVSLDDVLAIFQQMGIGTGENKVSTETDTLNGPLTGDEAALKSAFFQNDKDTLGSDFPELNDELMTLEGNIEQATPYVKLIGGLAKDNNMEQPGKAGLGNLPNGMLGGCIPPDNDYRYDTSAPGYTDGSMSLTGKGPQNDPQRLVADLPVSDDYDPDYDDEEDDELLLDMDDEAIDGQDEDVSSMMEGPGDEEDVDGEFKNPDLDRFAGDLDYSDQSDDEQITFDDNDLTPEVEEKQPAAITMNKDVRIGGQVVKLILTGVMITTGEVKYIGESVKKAGNKLKEIKGHGDCLEIYVEANDKRYKITYVDQPRSQTKTPFSIKTHKFQSLEEALERINHSRELNEKRVFEQIIDSDIIGRETLQLKESDIFKEFKEQTIDYVSSWNVKSVGYLNLKNGLNETFSKITQTGKEQNTLVESEDGTFYLIKGNLKERSKTGTKKELVDTRINKNYGIINVVGLYENTQEGLGEIMYKIKRTSVPLLVWR